MARCASAAAATTGSSRTSRRPTTLADSITCYLHGKDRNRPHLLAGAFTDGARLEMTVADGAAIDFPALTIGRDAIAELLVSRFNQRFENVYSFCIGAPPSATATGWDCDWLVVMSGKGSGQVRLGCGRYAWRAAADEPRVRSLRIDIEQMRVLPPAALPALMAWAAQLPYPWLPATRLHAQAPALPELQPLLQRLAGPPDDTRR